jgi:hypothetical protein
LSYKNFKTKKEFESVLNDEIKKARKASEAQKKFKREDSDDSENEEEVIILEPRPVPLTLMNIPIQDNIVPVEIQPVVKHRRILSDDF